MKLNNISKGTLYTIGSLLANAFVPLLSQWSMRSFNPFEIAFLISILNAFYCLLWHWIWPVFSKGFSPQAYIKSALINSIGIICLYSSLKFLDPISFAFFSVFYVVFTITISTFILKEGRTGIELFAIAVGILGAFFLARKGNANWKSFYGIGLVLLDTFCFAVANYQVKAASPPLHPVGVLFFNNIICSLVAIAIILPSLGRYSSFHIDPAHVLGILAASACSFAAVGLVFAGYRLLSFRLSSLIRAMKPLISTGVALPFAPVELSGGNWLGAFLLFISILVLASKEKRGA